jgi:hypothetical protein
MLKLKAWKEMDGKDFENRPSRLMKNGSLRGMAVWHPGMVSSRKVSFGLADLPPGHKDLEIVLRINR